jgi:hypothetical protein
MRRVVIVIVGCWIGLVAPARPQALSPSPIWVDLDAVLTRPLGEFGRHAGDALGFAGSLVVRFGQRRALAVRAEASAWRYDSETTPIGTCLPCLLIGGHAELVTSHTIFTIGVGPELTLPIGPVRLGLTPLIGISRFATRSKVQTSVFFFVPAGERDAGHTSATKLWLGGGADLTVPVRRRRGERPVSAQLGVRYLRNGRVRYVTPSGVSVDADGAVSFAPTVSEANLVQLRLGISVGIRAPDGDPRSRPRGSRRVARS